MFSAVEWGILSRGLPTVGRVSVHVAYTQKILFSWISVGVFKFCGSVLEGPDRNRIWPSEQDYEEDPSCWTLNPEP